MHFKSLRILLALALLIWPVTAQAAGGNDIPPGTVIFVAGEFPETSIMMVDPGGGSMPSMLADYKNGPNIQPAVGPEGRLAWVRGNGKKWELVEGGRVISDGHLHLSPAFKPDGALVAAVSEASETSLYIFSGNTRTLLIRGDGIAVSPSFSPDGSRLAFVSDESGEGQIYIAAADGTSATRLITSQVLSTDPAWSPTDEYIAFVTDETDICLIRPDGTGLRQLTQNQGRNSKPDFSPDGQMIVFSSNRDGGIMKLFVMKLDGSDQRPLLPGFSPPQSQPVWAGVKPTPVAE